MLYNLFWLTDFIAVSENTCSLFLQTIVWNQVSKMLYYEDVLTVLIHL